jgi:hypothetical protein
MQKPILLLLTKENRLKTDYIKRGGYHTKVPHLRRVSNCCTYNTACLMGRYVYGISPTVFHTLSSNNSFVIATKSKAECRFHTTPYFFRFYKKEQDRKCAHNVTLRGGQVCSSWTLSQMVTALNPLGGSGPRSCRRRRCCCSQLYAYVQD